MFGLLTKVRRLRFACRKLRLGVPRDALVLEVGSGESPCPRSDVLFDLTLEEHERVGGETVVDRPIALGLVERLPFRDKSFDYVVAFHVLEHSADPVRFLAELERVAKAGYIETPSFWCERVQPLRMHRLQVGLEAFEGGERLVIEQKTAPTPDVELANQFDRILRQRVGLQHVHPKMWVTQFWWRGVLPYRITNRDYTINWSPPPEPPRPPHNPRPLTHRLGFRAASLFRPRRPIDLLPLLQCPDCGNAPLAGSLAEARLACPVCGRSFSFTGGVAKLHPADWIPAGPSAVA